LPASSYGPPVRGSLDGFDAQGHLNLFDNVSLGFGVSPDVVARLDSGSGADDSILFSGTALHPPYLSLANGGTYGAVKRGLGDGVQFVIGGVSLSGGADSYPTGITSTIARMGGQPLPYDTRSANSILGGFNLEFAPWGGVTFTGSETSEHDG